MNLLTVQVSRAYVTVARPQRTPLLRLLGTPERCRSFHVSSSLFYGRLQNLEDIANRDRDNASAQAMFLRVRYECFLMLICRPCWKGTPSTL